MGTNCPHVCIKNTNMKSVRQTLTERRSIRRYEREPITDEQLSFIHDAIRNTPTSYNAQQFSVIEVSDQTLKEQLYELTGQKQIKTCNRFLAFCADFHRIEIGAEAKGIEFPPIYDTADGLILGIVDASLAMMIAVVAAESEGLGTCCVGYARTANPAAISKLLNLPQHVFLVCGLAIGVPRELPDLKPKLPTSVLIHDNTYQSDNLRRDLIDYDKTVSNYNRTRSGGTSENDWIGHIISYYREAMNYTMLQALQTRGFNPKK